MEGRGGYTSGRLGDRGSTRGGRGGPREGSLLLLLQRVRTHKLSLPLSLPLLLKQVILYLILHHLFLT